MSKKESNKKIIVNNMIWRYSERILAQLATFAVSVVLARLLAPSDFGNVALLLVFIDIANVLVVQGFSSALVQKKDADNIDFSSVFFFNIFVSIIMQSKKFNNKNFIKYQRTNEINDKNYTKHNNISSSKKIIINMSLINNLNIERNHFSSEIGNNKMARS